MKLSLTSVGILLLALPVLAASVFTSEAAQAPPKHSAHKTYPKAGKAKVQPSHRLKSNTATLTPAQLEVIQPLVPGTTVEITPLLTTGDILANGYQMAATPDGLGAYKSGTNVFTVMMNHELISAGGNLSDSRVSQLVFKKNADGSFAPQRGDYRINGTEGYHRFCSATLTGPFAKTGFSNQYFLTNEESTDSTFGGISVAVNTLKGTHTDLPWVGHFSHENTVAVPDYNKIVLVSTDDNAPGHIYMYIAKNESDLLAGIGQLYVFKAEAETTPEELKNLNPVKGSFVPIDQAENTDVTTLRAAASAKGAMDFVRPEDIVYQSNAHKTLYFATTGRSAYLNPNTNLPYDAKGRIHKMVLDGKDPTKVKSLSIVLNGDQGDDILNPDNVASSNKGLMIQEDINDEFRGTRPGRVLFFNYATRELIPLVEVAQKDSSGNPVGIPGDWESSGIINTTQVFGPDTWLLDVQAHTLPTAQFGGTDEGGQLLLLKVPGSSP